METVHTTQQYHDVFMLAGKHLKALGKSWSYQLQWKLLQTWRAQQALLSTTLHWEVGHLVFSSSEHTRWTYKRAGPKGHLWVQRPEDRQHLSLPSKFQSRVSRPSGIRLNFRGENRWTQHHYSSLPESFPYLQPSNYAVLQEFLIKRFNN